MILLQTSAHNLTQLMTELFNISSNVLFYFEIDEK